MMSTITASSLAQQFEEVRARTENLCQPLQIEDYVPQPADFVSPPKWHLAHTTWFFEQFLLSDHLDGYHVFHEDFSFMFNSYYNTIGKRTMRADRGNMTRPTLDEVRQYRAHVDEHMKQLLEVKADDETIAGLLAIGLNHEQQHQELLTTDLKYTLGHNPLFPLYQQGGSLMGQHNTDIGWHRVAGGVYEIGFEGNGFSYDNEHNRHKIYIQPCAISKALVTNGEYLEFIQDNGYGRHELWLDEGWAWVNNAQIKHPMHWHHIEGEWHYFTLGGLQKVDSEAQLAHVSYYEAAAYAEWAGKRLPTEAEWEIASDHFPWGNRWEWTGSAYLPYPGFKKPPGAVGEYNGKFMINQMVLRGASSATAPNHSRKTYRNFFHPQLQWQFAGIRLAHDE